VESTTSSRTGLNYVIVGVTFLIVGIVIGVTVSNALISKQDVEEAVRVALADTTVSIDDSALQTAIAAITSSGNGGTIDAATVSTLVAAALEQNEKDKAQKERVKMIDDDPSIGPEDAPIVIVEFSAYACPYCGRHFTETFQPLLENYGQYIRYVYRDFPVINQDVSFPTSFAAECADDQGKFWEFHDAMFRNQELLGRDLYLRVATEEGLDIEQFTQCIDSEQHENEVMDDYYAGDSLNITGTPSFYINGEIISGALPYDRFERIVLGQLEEAGIIVEPAAESTPDAGASS
jgi:protein-disulfide isomerase